MLSTIIPLSSLDIPDFSIDFHFVSIKLQIRNLKNSSLIPVESEPWVRLRPKNLLTSFSRLFKPGVGRSLSIAAANTDRPQRNFMRDLNGVSGRIVWVMLSMNGFEPFSRFSVPSQNQRNVRLRALLTSWE